MADVVRVDRVSFAYGSRLVVGNVSFPVPASAFVSLLGPSGCGKTTLLKLLGGYLQPATGTIELDGRDVTGVPPEARDTGMVFQNHALFPHLSARGNVEFGLWVRGVRRSQVRERAAEMLLRVGLEPADHDRRPAQLSGGQQQRVALARALVFEPRLLLLDEPFASLDRRLREQLREELARLHRETRVATVLVTHDQEEALACSEFIGVLYAGRLLQFGPPREVYLQPRTPFVARFLGEANLIPGPKLGLPADAIALIRPEAIGLDGTEQGTVLSTSFQGADLIAEVQTADFVLRIRTRSAAGLSPGDRVGLEIPSERIWQIPERDAPA